jgi:Fe-S cluster biogenesis protein NfuA|eukprot:GDKH01001986.1.p2 GENE.GDKH01001986.1~~GDKH01001986.1.p2  ORF type:complete len:79 (+),score=13.14 GDKH01001986.1:65-301(+)
MNPELAKRVEAVLDTMRPFLNADGGNVELVDIADDKIVNLRLLGACSSCEMSHMTMKAGIEEGIKKAIPEIESVIAIN